MDCLRYPVIFGCHDKADKVCVVARDNMLRGYALLACHIKNRNVKFGEAVEKDDVGSVIFQMNFCKLEPAKAFLKCVERLVEAMEKEQCS